LIYQAIEVLKRMVYKCDPHLPIEIFKVVMYATDEYGNEKMLK